MNTRKSDMPNVLDPFDIQTGWFELELVEFQVKPCAEVPADIRGRIEETIRLLQLNDWQCRELRQSYADDYWEGHIDLHYLSRKSPFVAMELRRQNRLLLDGKTSGSRQFTPSRRTRHRRPMEFD